MLQPSAAISDCIQPAMPADRSIECTWQTMAGSAEATVCITEALIREYLTKKGLAGTLEVYNNEKPSFSAQPITKRSQLIKLLGLEAEAGRHKTAASQQPAMTTLDMLVEHTMQQLVLQEQGRCTIPETCTSSAKQTLAAQEARPVQAISSSHQNGAQQAMPSTAGREVRRPGSAAPQRSSAGEAAAPCRVAHSSSHQAAPAESPAAEADSLPALSELCIEDVDDVDDAEHPAAQHVGPAPTTITASSQHSANGVSMAGMPPGQPLQPEQAKQLRQLLWGGQGRPPNSWQQGLFFGGAAGLSWGLVQLEGGSCGVLAAVQGFVLAALQGQGLLGHALHPSLQQRQEALAEAVCDVVWQARPADYARAHIVSAAAGPINPQALQHLSYDQLNRECVARSAGSRAELGVLVRCILPQLCEPKGWGIMLLLHSLLLTRGLDTTRQDTDEADSSLIGPHGYCTNELVNLLLTGAATSNVFDGVQSLGPGSALRGVSHRSKVGMLTLFEWYRYVEVGANLKSPQCPIWVVCSESHYSTMFVMPEDSSQAWGQATHQLRPPLQLSYYDGIANQEQPITLAVASASGAGWTGKLEGVAEERGVWQGRPIPPLELVIESKWPNVSVQWHGCEALL